MKLKNKYFIKEDDNEQPNYYSIIPANVRYDKNLKANEKLLYSEITALANAIGYCYANNSYFASLYDVDNCTISRWISNLERYGYITTKIIYKENSKQIDKRYIYIVSFSTSEKILENITLTSNPIDKNINTPIDKNINTPIDKNINTPIDKKIKDNNTSINNTSINNKEKYIKRKNEIDSLDFIENEEEKKIFSKWLDYKKERKQTYKSKTSIKTCYERLLKLSSGNIVEMEKIINQSIANNYSGLFELKKNSYNRNTDFIPY